MEYNADIAFALIDRLKLIHPLIVGHSYGGSIALAMAVRRPRQVKAFITVGARAYPKQRSAYIFHLLRFPILGNVLAEATSRFVGQNIMRQKIVKLFTPNEQCIPSDFTATRSALWLRAASLITLAKEDTNISSDLTVLAPCYPEIEHDLVLIHGEQDHAVPVADAKRLHNTLPQSRLFILPQTGHMAHFIRTEEVLRIINETVGHSQ